MDTKTSENLLEQAKAAAKTNTCCSYSNFTVGAALLDSNGKVHVGINIENHGIQSICAERTAFVGALTTGTKSFRAIAVVGKKLDAKCFSRTLPCGYCRQFMSEFAGPDLEVITQDEADNKIYTNKLSELLPNAFLNF